MVGGRDHHDGGETAPEAPGGKRASFVLGPGDGLRDLLDALVQEKQLSSRELCRTIKGPDFPTGGQIVSSAEELKQIYETGQGTIKVRGTWRPGKEGRSSKTVLITSIPYAVNKATLVERIAEVAVSRKLPMLLDVRDVSTDDVCIELELKKEADENLVFAYLYKNTPLQSGFAVNLTCLVPTEQAEVGRPERLDLWTFLSNLAARSFYERHGFVATDTTDGDNEERAPDVHYRWPRP